MSPAIRLVLLSCLVCAWGCSVPSLEQVEKKVGKPYACDESHACPTAQMCLDGACVPNTCAAGATQSCNLSTDQCGEGVRTCEPDGTYGECKPHVNSVPEGVCAGVDLNCDGRFGNDELISQNLLWGTYQSTALNQKDGKLLFVTSEAVIDSKGVPTQDRQVVVYGIDDKGSSGQKNHSAADEGKSFLSPALINFNDASGTPQVLAVWIEQDSHGSNVFTLNAAPPDELDKSRVSIASLVPSLPSGQHVYVSGLTLAANADHLLVLVSTSTSSASDDDTAGIRQTFAITLPLSRSGSTFSSWYPLATPKTRYGLSATASADGSGFLVSYENQGMSYLRAIANSGELDPTPLNIKPPPNSTIHSPFIKPITEGAMVYFVSNDNGTGESEILSSQCSFGSTAAGDCTLQQPASYQSNHFIRRARIGPSPADKNKLIALLVERDEGVAQSNLFVTSLSKDMSGTARPLVNFSTFDEQITALPGDADKYFYLIYQQRAGAMNFEAHALQFCTLF